MRGVCLGERRSPPSRKVLDRYRWRVRAGTFRPSLWTQKSKEKPDMIGPFLRALGFARLLCIVLGPSSEQQRYLCNYKHSLTESQVTLISKLPVCFCFDNRALFRRNVKRTGGLPLLSHGSMHRSTLLLKIMSNDERHDWGDPTDGVELVRKTLLNVICDFTKARQSIWTGKGSRPANLVVYLLRPLVYCTPAHGFDRQCRVDVKASRNIWEADIFRLNMTRV